MAHIINLIVKDGLRDAALPIEWIRNTIRYIRHSPQRLDAFKKCVKAERIESKALLCLDMPTRWNSTYEMLDRAEKFEKAFQAFDLAHPNFRNHFVDGVPKTKDWSYAYKKMKDTDLESKLMAERMQDKFDKYWGTSNRGFNYILYFAAILDPRLKLRVISFGFKEVFTAENRKDETADQLKKRIETSVKLVTEELEILFKHYELNCERPKLHKYLDDIEEPDYEGFDILEWWKASSSKYPIVAKMAKDILAIPVSSVALESAFSTGGRVVEPYRSSLAPSLVEALILHRGLDWCVNHQMDPMNARKRSSYNVWTDFEKLFDEDGTPKARCKHCSSVFRADAKKNGIAMLIRHHKICPLRLGRSGPLTGRVGFLALHSPTRECPNGGVGGSRGGGGGREDGGSNGPSMVREEFKCQVVEEDDGLITGTTV
ncbi:zinc finger BED domain-containing protein RICESLEEPER 2-like [Bidens hawaiensis]|uniref:zinc finger BED domain-containing protein RICESLEEPER 2-like n=1 Tax=Bidens hawaiensis TaxID=980011 RepID=UPI004049DE54